MAFNFNGTTIATLAESVVMNGVNCTKVYMNGALVWEQAAPPGSVDITSDGLFTVPIGVYSIEVCLCGGGGGGSTTDDRSAGGGNKGNGSFNAGLAVTPGQVLSIAVGAAGAGAPQAAYTYGTAGGTTYLRNNSNSAVLMSGTGGSPGTLGGGPGGNPADVTYAGNGASHTYCDGAHTDGLQNWATGRYMGGGESGYFGNGANGGTNANAANNSGAGGGAASKHITGGAGNGGSGRVRITWPGV